MPRQNNSKNIPIKPISKLPPIVITKNNTTLFQSIKDGFGFSIGSTIARNLFGTTPTYVSSNNVDIKKSTCIEYKKCLETNDKYECFSNLDQKEYVECRIKE